MKEKTQTKGSAKRSFYHASVSCIRFMRPFFCSYGKQGV